MKKIIIMLFFIALFFDKTYGQAIQFQPLSWQQALAKARTENKMIFIDVYTSWCGYCKQMDTEIFSLAETGIFYNQHFINLKYDAQKTDGIAIRKCYALLGFPTFLYLDKDGMLVKKTAGYQNKNVFIQNGIDAFSLVHNGTKKHE